MASLLFLALAFALAAMATAAAAATAGWSQAVQSRRRASKTAGRASTVMVTDAFVIVIILGFFYLTLRVVQAPALEFDGLEIQHLIDSFLQVRVQVVAMTDCFDILVIISN